MFAVNSAVKDVKRVTEISLDFIEWRDLSTFVRCGIDGDQVENLKAAYEAEADVPPVDLFAERTSASSKNDTGSAECDAGGARNAQPQTGRVRYCIADGWHRFYAVRELGRPVISAIVHVGGRHEALKFALGANAAHGLRRTNKDKRKAVEIALREYPKLSNRAIADLCRVSHVMVNDIRKEVEESSTCDCGAANSCKESPGSIYDERLQVSNACKCRTGLDGKHYPVKVPASLQLDFFELVGREWAPVVKSFDLTIKSVVWLDDRVEAEKKLEAISSMRRQLDYMRAQLAERERTIKAGLDSYPRTAVGALHVRSDINVPEGVTA